MVVIQHHDDYLCMTLYLISHSSFNSLLPPLTFFIVDGIVMSIWCTISYIHEWLNFGVQMLNDEKVLSPSPSWLVWYWGLGMLWLLSKLAWSWVSKKGCCEVFALASSIWSWYLSTLLSCLIFSFCIDASMQAMHTLWSCNASQSVWACSTWPCSWRSVM